MGQSDYLTLSEDGKTVIDCKKDYEGAVVIPDGVTKIGDRAFEGCTGLTSIKIPDGVKSIGDSAFEDCSSLMSIMIPNGVKTIGVAAFYYCTSLKSMVIPNNVTKIEHDIFRGCASLTSIVIPDSVTEIGNGAFEGCASLTSIEIPDSVTEIGNGAFSGCTGLTSIVIPNNVKKIGEWAFSGCTNLKNIQVNENNPKYCSKDGVLYSKDMSTLIAIPDSKDSVEIPDSVTEIDWTTFSFTYCSNLKNIQVNENNPKYCSKDGVLYSKDMSTLIAIPNGKDSVVIPDSVTKIELDILSGCIGLTSIVIPDSVKTIGEWAFSNCTLLTEVHLKHKLPIDFSEAFKSIDDFDKPNVTIYVPKGSGEAYRNSGFYKGFKDIIEE